MADRELKIREAFEAYVTEENSSISLERWPSGGYKYSTIEGQWNGWRACAVRTPVQPVAQMSGERLTRHQADVIRIADNCEGISNQFAPEFSAFEVRGLIGSLRAKDATITRLNAATVPQVAQSVPLDMFIAEYGHKLAVAFGIEYYDLADRDAQIKERINTTPALAAPCVLDDEQIQMAKWIISSPHRKDEACDECEGTMVVSGFRCGFHIAKSLLTTASNAGEAAQGEKS